MSAVARNRALAKRTASKKNGTPVSRRKYGKVGVAALAKAGAVVALALLPVAAQAVTRVVTPGGSPTDSTCTAGTPCSMSRANADARPGDIVDVRPGWHTTAPNPVNSGTDYATRIRYVGSVLTPADIDVPAITLTKDHVSIIGMDVQGGVTFTNDARNDSLAYCLLRADLRFAGAKFNMAYGDTMPAGGRVIFGEKAGISTQADTLRRCVLRLEAAAQPHLFEMYDFTQSCAVDSNRTTLVIPANANDVHPRILYHAQLNYFGDNWWGIENYATSGTGWAGLMIRDSTRRNLFQRDTLVSLGPRESRFYLAGTGSVGQSADNRFVGCVFKNAVGGPTAIYQAPARLDTIQQCVFSGPGQPFHLGDVVGPMLIDNCTFFGGPYAGVLNMDPSPDAAWTDSLIFTDNVIASASPATGPNDYGSYWVKLAFNGHLRSHNNVYWTQNVDSSRAVGFWNGSASIASKVGSASDSLHKWRVHYGHDLSSKHGDPLFSNASVSGFDAHLLPGSAAIAAASDGTDCGAYQTAADATRPDEIVVSDTLYRSKTTMQVTWIATGDDSLTGTAAAHDLRYSTGPITASNFSTRWQVEGLSAPQPSGTQETITVGGLLPGRTYYFAIKARDENGNWSGISNLVYGRTKQTDSQPDLFFLEE